jgi:hypothetical protein
MDFRLWEPINKWAEDNGLIGECDLISLGGTLKDILGNDDSVSEYLLSQVDISYNLHQARVGYILDHMDCGAWGGKEAFSGADADFSHHADILRQVAEVIKEKYPDLVLHLIVLKMDGDRVTDFTEIK